jgi:hypothetical protein
MSLRTVRLLPQGKSRAPATLSHSSDGGRKAYLHFELKDLQPPEAAALRAVLDFKVLIRKGSAVRRMGFSARDAAITDSL